MDIKNKFKVFIEDSKQKILSPNSEERVEITAEEYHQSLGGGMRAAAAGGHRAAAVHWPDKEVHTMKTDPHADQEVLEGMNTSYYDEAFDPSDYELARMPALLDQSVIDAERKQLMRQLTVVSKRVFMLILERQAACSDEMKKILSVQADLSNALVTCYQSRRSLDRAKLQFTSSSLGILSGIRRKHQALSVIESLNTIQTLLRTEERLQELLSEDNYPDAIRLLLECQKVAANYRHFVTIRQLSAKLQDTAFMTEEQLDVALAKVCVNFQRTTYAKLQEAYKLLGKTQTAMDQLLMHLTSAIHNTSWNVVFGHVMLTAGAGQTEFDLGKRPYPELCQSVATETFLPCLIDLCRSLWGIMLSYKKILDWHQTEVWSKPLDVSGSENDPVYVEAGLQQQYVQKKLETGLSRIWQDVQTKVKVYVLASDLSRYPIDSFLQVLDLIHLLMEVGSDFCGGSSESLQESLKRQSLAYFQSYHASRLDELKTHLENEGWALCPVRPNFNLFQLAEFAHLRSTKPASVASTKLDDKSIFKAHWDSGSPFDAANNDQVVEDILLVQDLDRSGFYSDDSDDDISESLKQEILNENSSDSRRTTLTPLRATNRLPEPPAPVRKTGIPIANTTLMLLRLFGKYSHMIKMLSPISSEVITGIAQLFEYYAYTVHSFFASDLPESESRVYASSLRGFVKRVYDEVIVHEVVLAETNPVGAPSHALRRVGVADEAFLSPGVNLQDPSNVGGLAERLVAVESVVFLASQLAELRPYLEAARADCGSLVANFFAESVDVVRNLRSPVYLSSLVKTLRMDGLLPYMGRVAWGIKDVHSQHSPYVDLFLNEMEGFKGKLARIASEVPVGKDTETLLWQLAVLAVSNIFVEGFSNAKNCTNEGRALMQLDYRQFVIKLEKICGLQPLPYQEFVTAYIKAYYIPESEVEAWVNQHTEYSPKQLVALINAVAQNNNKTKQKLNNIINELSGRIRR